MEVGDENTWFTECLHIFNGSRQDFTFYNDAVTLVQKTFSEMRTVMFAVQYNFNVTRARYAGSGAGNTEKRRF